jgi:hypothetical protein
MQLLMSLWMSLLIQLMWVFDARWASQMVTTRVVFYVVVSYDP